MHENTNLADACMQFSSCAQYTQHMDIPHIQGGQCKRSLATEPPLTDILIFLNNYPTQGVTLIVKTSN